MRMEELELELELIQSHMAQKPVLRELTFVTPPPSVGGIGSRQQKQRLRAPRRRSRPPSVLIESIGNSWSDYFKQTNVG